MKLPKKIEGANNFYRQLEMGRNGWKLLICLEWLEVAGIAASSYTYFEMAVHGWNGLKWPEVTENGINCVGMPEWLEKAGNG